MLKQYLLKIGHFLKKVGRKTFNFATSTEGTIIIGFFLLLLIVPEFVHAADEDVVTSMTKKMNTLIRFINAIFWPILLLIGALMENHLILGGVMEETLLKIWVEIRNIVNLVFVVILLGVAIVNIAGLKEKLGESFDIKAMLPKIVVGLIIVNFSFLGCKVILDASNVLTQAAFSLPNVVSEGGDFTAKGQSILAECNESIKKQSNGQLSSNPKVAFLQLICKDNKTVSRSEQLTMINFFDKFRSRNAAMILAIYMGKLQMVEELPPKGTIQTIVDMGINTIFRLVLYVVFGVAYIALFLILLVRLVVLWLGIALSPIIGVGLVMPEIANMGGEGGGKIKEQFINHAIAPIKIGLALSIGFIMLDAFKAGGSGALSEGVGGSYNFFGTTAAASGLGDIQQLLIASATVAVIWMGVMAAAETTLASGIINTFAEPIKGLGQWVATAPFKYMPMIPVPAPTGSKEKSKRLSLSGILGAVGAVKSGVEMKQGQTSGAQYMRKLVPWLGNTMDSNKTAIGRSNNVKKLISTNNPNQLTVNNLKSVVSSEIAQRSKAESKNLGDIYKTILGEVGRASGSNAKMAILETALLQGGRLHSANLKNFHISAAAGQKKRKESAKKSKTPNTTNNPAIPSTTNPLITAKSALTPLFKKEATTTGEISNITTKLNTAINQHLKGADNLGAIGRVDQIAKSTESPKDKQLKLQSVLNQYFK